MKLRVQVTMRGGGQGTGEISWMRAERQERECVAIRATQLQGAGNCLIQYEAKTVEGEWFPFLKKENRRAKLPTIEQIGWEGERLVDVRGLRGVYERLSHEVLL